MLRGNQMRLTCDRKLVHYYSLTVELGASVESGRDKISISYAQPRAAAGEVPAYLQPRRYPQTSDISRPTCWRGTRVPPTSTVSPDLGHFTTNLLERCPRTSNLDGIPRPRTFHDQLAGEVPAYLQPRRYPQTSDISRPTCWRGARVPPTSTVSPDLGHFTTNLMERCPRTSNLDGIPRPRTFHDQLAGEVPAYLQPRRYPQTSDISRPTCSTKEMNVHPFTPLL
ncbi:hypothetical protein RRG08_066524 [Elysia crispata]|uniref:Uncharacterized protein n=1 Tax=Elysia crispata TaxID=231223 RepID=A0AAE1DJ70_9GAST|nr:hypothetical protein RRG08_066524 [Elysia crispata]